MAHMWYKFSCLKASESFLNFYYYFCTYLYFIYFYIDNNNKSNNNISYAVYSFMVLMYMRMFIIFS